MKENTNTFRQTEIETVIAFKHTLNEILKDFLRQKKSLSPIKIWKYKK